MLTVPNPAVWWRVKHGIITHPQAPSTTRLDFIVYLALFGSRSVYMWRSFFYVMQIVRLKEHDRRFNPLVCGMDPMSMYLFQDLMWIKSNRHHMSIVFSLLGFNLCAQHASKLLVSGFEFLPDRRARCSSPLIAIWPKNSQSI